MRVFTKSNCMIFKRIKKNWKVANGQPLTELDKKILSYQNRGCLVPTNDLILNEYQIDGIRKSGVINTGVLDMVSREIHAGMTTAALDKMVYEYTCDHGAIPADLNYEGYPKSCCISINDVVCHGVPSDREYIEDGDIVNVDVSTILNGYYSDASRMFMIGDVTPNARRLVEVTKECLRVGMEAAKPWGFVGDIGHAIEKHAKKNGYSVVREYCGHGVGLEFHLDPEVCHYGHKGTGMLLVPGMCFTIEPMINEGKADICDDMDDETGWVVLTEDGSLSAQWEHTFLMTEKGLEILTY